jgi:hypothetical protein
MEKGKLWNHLKGMEPDPWYQIKLTVWLVSNADSYFAFG